MWVDTTMNSIAVFLILAFLTGFQARVLDDKPTKSTLEQVQEQVAENINMILDTLKNFSSEGLQRAQDLAKQVPTQLSKQSNNMQKLNQNLQRYAKNAKQKVQEGVSQIQAHAAPQVKKLMNWAEPQYQAVISGIKTAMDKVENMVQPVTEDLKGYAQEMAKQLDQVRQKFLSWFTEQSSPVIQPQAKKRPPEIPH